MIILEVRSSWLGCDLIWFATSQGNASRLGWPSNILLWVLQERGHLVYFKTQSADKRENRFPSLCQCSQRKGKRPCHWSLTSRVSAAIDWPEHAHPERVMLDGFRDLVKPRNSKILRKPENTILWRWDILQCSTLGIFYLAAIGNAYLGNSQAYIEQRCTIHISICPFALSSTEEIRISKNKELPSFYWALRHRPEPWSQATYLHHSCLSAGYMRKH